MSINDPLRIEPHKGEFIVCRGPETFYDPETREIITHETADDAKAWAYVHLGTIPLWDDQVSVSESLVNLPLFQDGESG